MLAVHVDCHSGSQLALDGGCVAAALPFAEQPAPVACAEEDEAFFQSLLRGLAGREVQRFARGWLARRCFLRQRRAAARIQRAWRAAWPVLQARTSAARMIQRAWRGHCCHGTFRQLSQFVRAAEGGDPRLALAAIAQHAEAGVADAAAGVRVRFRLDGRCCPPALVYTVVTHRPVAQLGLACLDAAAAVECCQTAAAPPRPQWRAVPAGLRLRVTKLARPAAACSTAGQQRGGPPPLPGGQQKRQVRRAQLQQLYQEGRQQDAAASGSAGGGGGAALNRSAGNSRQALAGTPGGAVEEGEEELLLWSRLLDYEEYTRSWLALGSSAWTDAHLERP